jgi:hypothetical protein
VNSGYFLSRACACAFAFPVLVLIIVGYCICALFYVGCFSESETHNKYHMCMNTFVVLNCYICFGQQCLHD